MLLYKKPKLQKVLVPQNPRFQIDVTKTLKKLSYCPRVITLNKFGSKYDVNYIWSQRLYDFEFKLALERNWKFPSRIFSLKRFIHELEDELRRLFFFFFFPSSFLFRFFSLKIESSKIRVCPCFHFRNHHRHHHHHYTIITTMHCHYHHHHHHHHVLENLFIFLMGNRRK